MNNNSGFDFKFRSTPAPKQNTPASLALTTAIPQDWSGIVDRLSVVPLALLGGGGTPSLYQNLISRNLSSLAFSAYFPFPKGFLRYRYTYRSDATAQLTLKGLSESNQSGGSHALRFDIKIADPKFVFPLYLAQRQARAERGACELCGKPLGWIKTRKSDWHHASCHRFCSYTVEEENAVRATGSFCDGTAQIGSNAPASNNASKVVNQKSSEPLLSVISRKFLSRR